MSQSLDSRRRWLAQAGALASSTVLPLRLAWAQSQSTLNALPRVALVIGNTKYAEAPLKNPGNDAKAIAGELQKVGFAVNLKLDAGRNDMVEAIRAFGAELGKKKGVGMFYYAGHGAQLAWKNYLIPVDAEIDRIEDMQTKTVELNSLLEGIVKAQNPMNVIILDACRDNPFGSKVNTQQKGLSQFDAPPGSLLAYATSPGNTAADGSGANGLYTENLLREIRVPDAKIEDVFKRVRLAVRRKSEGQQIPWESTSLEEDFYFLPPASIKKLSEKELEKAFDEELAIWNKVKESKEPAPLVSYLEKYPSGKFSELAQFQLDRVLKAQGEKKIAVAVEKDNPFTKGTARTDTNYRMGDSYTYRILDALSRAEQSRFVETVTDIAADQIIYNGGETTTDFLGNEIKSTKVNYLSPAQFYPAEYELNKKWSTRFRIKSFDGQDVTIELEFKVASKERFESPVGTVEAFKVEGIGGPWTYRYWIAPSVARKALVIEHLVTRRDSYRGRYLRADRYELVSFKQV